MMKFSIYSVIILLLIISSDIYRIQLIAQNILPENYESSCLTEKGEVYFKFRAQTKQQVIDLSKVISIDNRVSENELIVYAYANRNELNRFKRFNISYDVLPHPGSLVKNPVMLNDITQRDITSWDFYPTYSAYLAMMYQFETDYPNICRIENIGQSINGREILYIVISDNVNTVEAEPRFNYTSTMHGDETVGYILTLRLIDYLLSNYGTNAQVDELVNGIEIWINPLSNPDGTFYGGNNSVSGAVRYNANGVDLNRNYKDFDDGNHPDGNAWQPENILMMNLADSIRFVMSANMHTGAEVINYPWDTQSIFSADDAWWQFVSRQWADTTHVYAPTGYLTSLNDGITNGYAWYTISGGRQDYMNYYHNCREFTLELSNVKNPPANTLPGFWDNNYRSMLNYMNQVLYGVKGVVTDSITGDPLLANVFISGHDVDNTDVYTKLPYGDYYRPIYSGTYDITYSAGGYASKTVIGVSVTNGNSTVLDVQLAPAAPSVNFIADITSSCIGFIQFTDFTSTSPNSTYLWNFGDGTTSTEVNPTHVYSINGVFDVSLTVTNGIGSNTHVELAFIYINLPDAPTVTDGSICGSDSVVLSATAIGTINWYNDSIGGSPFHTGSIYTTPVLTVSHNYFVESNVEPSPQNASKPDNTGGGGYYTNNTTHFLVFDCFAPLTIKTIKVYANSSGNRLIALRDNTGTILDFEIVNISAGEQTVTLDFDVPVGSDFELAGPTSPDLYRNNDGLNYPYEIPGVISIKHSSATSNPTGYYYYFYDWVVQEENCISARTMVTANVSNLAPTANYSYTQDLGIVEFANLTTEGFNYFWDFGDGTTSTDENPVHSYQASNNYTVKLVSTNACGSDSITEVISIIITISDNIENIDLFKIYPNPNTGLFALEFSAVPTNNLIITIIDVLGNEIYNESITQFKGKINKPIDLSSFPNGIYLIRLLSEKFVVTKRIVIEN